VLIDDLHNDDQVTVAWNRRARLLREAGSAVYGEQPSLLSNGRPLCDRLFADALAVATEAAMLVMETGAEHGEAYHHEDDGQLVVGWAIPDDELHLVPGRPVEVVQPKEGALRGGAWSSGRVTCGSGSIGSASWPTAAAPATCCAGTTTCTCA
jgi:hypothetical protein